MTEQSRDRDGHTAREYLAPYACQQATSRGRLYVEKPSPTRSDYQRDRDRIVHSTAFRRLNHKTQVFIYHEGDHYRSRLTHSLEVAQIARAMARTLSLDDDLAEAIALAHDLGHPPFGHAGERALNAAMSDYGGFDHNGQSLRVVTVLERKYAAFDGLNLTWESLEGLAKHNGPVVDTDGNPIGVYTETGVPRALEAYNEVQDLGLASYPSAEAQVAALADDIAYNNHDIDDGFRAGSYSLDDLADVPLAGEIISEIHNDFPQLERSRLIYEVNRRLITRMIDDAVNEARRRIAVLKPGEVGDIRNAVNPVISFSSEMDAACDELRDFLLSWVYRNDRILRIMDDAGHILQDLFSHYMQHPDSMPEHWFARAQDGDDMTRAGNICDFIAGMTDRYAVREHRRLFDRTPELR